MSIGKLLTNRNFYSVVLAVAISFAFVAIMVNGATTISSNISTGGTLTVSGDSTFTGDIFGTSTLAVTGLASFYDQVVLDNGTSDPTGAAAGAIYWDTTNEVIRVFDGTDWNTVASSTDAAGGLVLGGESQGVRFNTIANAYMALGTTTLPVVSASGNSLLFLNATTSATIPLVLQGWTSQSGDFIQVLNDLNSELFAVDSQGNASTSGLTITTRAADAFVVSGYATTSGSTGNIETEGTLTVTGTTGLTGAVTLTGALTVNGNTTLGNANSDTVTATAGTFSVGGYATTTVDLNDVFATSTIGYNTEAGGGGAFGVGTSTPGTGAQKFGVEGDVWVGSTGTTTIALHTSAAFGTCIQMVASDGNLVRVFVNNADALVVEVGACK